MLVYLVTFIFIFLVCFLCRALEAPAEKTRMIETYLGPGLNTSL